MATANGTILALDVGGARIGVALADGVARLAKPAGALPHDDHIFTQLRELCTREQVQRIVVGLPRGLDGQETAQTAQVRAFAAALSQHIALPLSWQDEAVTSVQAEAELRGRGKPYAKGDIDALAATYILEDYLHEEG